MVKRLTNVLLSARLFLAVPQLRELLVRLTEARQCLLVLSHLKFDQSELIDRVGRAPDIGYFAMDSNGPL